MPSRSIRGFVANGKISFLFYGWVMFVCVCATLVCWRALSFRALAVVNNAAVNIRVHISFQRSVCFLLRSEVAGSFGSSDFSRDLHSVFHSGCPSLRSCHRCTGVPALYIFTNIWHLLSFRQQPFWQTWHALMGISLMTGDVGCLFLCMLAIRMSLFRKMSVCVLFPSLKVERLLLSCMSSWSTLDINHSPDEWFAKISSCLFGGGSVGRFFRCAEAFLTSFHLFLLLSPLPEEFYLERSCWDQCQRAYCLCFLMAAGLTLAFNPS